jgi:alkylation response protein AidB-like acyl-CoA dehydrogenase
MHELAYKHGVYGAMWPKEYGGTPPGNQLSIY